MKKFTINLIIRLLFIFISFFLLLYLFQYTTLLITPIFIGALIIFQIYSLVKYVDQTNRILARFFDSIKFSDFSQSFTQLDQGKSFIELTKKLTKVQNAFIEARNKKEEQINFTESMIHNINVGIIVYDSKGNVELINNAAKKLLHLQFLNNINELSHAKFKISHDLLKVSFADKPTIELTEQNVRTILAAQISKFNTPQKNYTLLSIQNIQKELNQKEIESWQKLIKVLTHEIMNSVTPISSLSATLSNLHSKEENLSLEQIKDTKSGLESIKKRSEGLLNFVDKYRSLTKIPQPKLQTFKVIELFARINSLMENELNKNTIIINFKVIPSNLKLNADPELIEQVLINLIYNSISALTNVPYKEINISSSQTVSGRIEIQVSDNGNGMSDDVKEQIFIPFYTTKKNGSGIGLSLAKQIMQLHNGEIYVTSIKRKGTTIYLLF